MWRNRSIVLLKNANGQLPLARGVSSIAVIGSHADVGVLSGGGSAQVDPMGGNAVPQPARAGVFDRVVWHRSVAAEGDSAIRRRHAKVDIRSGRDAIPRPRRLAKASDVAIVFVNQPTSEGKRRAEPLASRTSKTRWSAPWRPPTRTPSW
jgi:beta-glucosidase